MLDEFMSIDRENHLIHWKGCNLEIPWNGTLLNQPVESYEISATEFYLFILLFF